MAKQTLNNIKLGMLLIAGLLIIIFSLYMIGRNHSMFGANFEIRARFRNAGGLVKGNNVRFSGIQAGTVKSVSIINDTTIEVTMTIDDDIRKHLHKNSVAAIGSEGLMGNKVVNIEPGNMPSGVVNEGDILPVLEESSMDDMMQTLDRTSRNVEYISEQLKETVAKINNSQAIWDLLNDTTISKDVKVSIANVRQASSRINAMSASLHEIVRDAKEDDNILQLLVNDTAAAHNLSNAILQINNASEAANQMMGHLQQITADIEKGKGAAGVLLKDTAVASDISKSLENIEEGTAAFSENMEALKHNFLFRKYFRKKEKRSDREK